MPMPKTLGLPVWDKTFFGLRRSDRPFSPPPETEALAKIDIAPALPPLQVLSKKSSFANILDQIQLSDSDDTRSAQALVPVANPIVVVEEDSTLTSFLNISEEEEDVETLSATKSATQVSSSINQTDSTMAVESARQEHRESSTSSASHSDQSDDLSARTSTSSLSSLEDVSYDEKILVEEIKKKPVPPPQQPGKTAQKVVYSTSDDLDEADPDVAVRHERSASMFVRSRGNNKPLPPDPFRPSRKGKEALREQRPPKTSKVPLPSRIPTLPKRSAYRENPCKIPPLDVNTTRYKSLQKRTSNVAGQTVNGDAAERVVLRIMRNLDSLSDLKATAMVNKGFYTVFQRYETDLVSRVLMNASLPAWELRQLIQQEQRRNPFRIKSVQRDMSALDALKAFIVMKCEKSCRSSTLDGLLGMDPARGKQIDDALWRIWLFCKLFGKGALKESTIQTQISWLEGKVKAEHGDMIRPHVRSKRRGVSMQEIEDMTEMWHCLEMLLAGFRGREEEAQRAGIFNQCFIDEGKGRTEADYLEEWIYDILSVGPKAVLTLISCSFEHARVLGVTKWTPPRSGKGRRSFLKAALEQVYRERLVTEARHTAGEFAKSMQVQAMQKQSSQERSASEPQAFVTTPTQTPSPVQRTNSEPQIPSPKDRVSELDATEASPARTPQPLFAGVQRESLTTSLVTDAASYSHLAMTNRASARLGANLFPINTNQNQKQDLDDAILETSPRNSIDLELEPKVIDPTDRAISLLVKQLGFSAAHAKQALALSDNGSGVNVQRAVEILSNGNTIEQKETTILELPGNGSLTTVRQSQEFCEGTCRRVSLVRRDTAKKRGFLSRNNSKQRESVAVSMVSNYEEENATYGPINSSQTTTVTVTNSRTIDPQEGLPSLADFIKFRQGLRPQNSVSSQFSQYSQARSHKKSSSTGTVETIQEDPHQYDSPISPLTSTATEASRLSDETIIGRTSSPDKDDEERPQRLVRRTTLTRVGTMKKPTTGRLNLARHVLKKDSMPEIIGYTYSNAA